MKNSFLLAGIAALMLSACNNKPAQELTLSGLNPVNFQTEVNVLFPLWFPTKTGICRTLFWVSTALLTM